MISIVLFPLLIFSKCHHPATINAPAFCFPLLCLGVGRFALQILSPLFSLFSRRRCLSPLRPPAPSLYSLPNFLHSVSRRQSVTARKHRGSVTMSPMNRGYNRCSVPLACFAARGQSAQLEYSFVLHPVWLFSAVSIGSCRSGMTLEKQFTCHGMTLNAAQFFPCPSRVRVTPFVSVLIL